MTGASAAFVGLMLAVSIIAASLLGWQVLVGVGLAALTLAGCLYLEGTAVRRARVRRRKRQERREALLKKVPLAAQLEAHLNSE